jgi:hypothetical protein
MHVLFGLKSDLLFVEEVIVVEVVVVVEVVAFKIKKYYLFHVFHGN